MMLNQVGRYKILELLGQGGMGAVYRAYDPGFEREVVVKLIALPTLANSDEYRQRFRREIQAAGKLKHPHIITVHDVDLAHDPPYVVMELLSGGTLQERLHQKTLSWPAALMVLRPLVQALAYAHAMGVIHRDLKPANVMFSGAGSSSLAQPESDEVLKLVDFGLARWQDAEGLTQAGMAIGTPAYMSPEQALGESIDHRTDIFALGIILFEAITGANPLRKESTVKTLLEAASFTQIDASPLVGKVPPGVIKLIERAIAKDRDRRYSNCEALLTDWDRCLNNPAQESTRLPAASSSTLKTSGGPDIRAAGQIDLTPEVKAVLQHMFKTFSQIVVEAEFGRGFSGSRVFRVRPFNKEGRAQLPTVVKVAPIGLIHAEAKAYQNWVKDTLPNVARLDLSLNLPAESLWTGLRYTLVGGGVFEVQSLRDYYQRAGVDDVCWVLENRLFKMMGQSWWLDNRANRTFQMQMDYDTLLPANLLLKPVASPLSQTAQLIEPASDLSLAGITAGDQVQLKNFVVAKADPQRRELTLNLPPAAEGPSASYIVRLRDAPDIIHYRVGDVVDSIRGEVVATRHDLITDQAGQALESKIDLSAERLSPWPHLSLPNPLFTYPNLLQDLLTVNISTIHGDLNTENILVDPATREVQLIDFATAHPGHVLRDLLRLETEVIIMFIPPGLAEVGLPAETIYPFYEQLHQDTLQPGQNSWSNLPSATLEKPFKVLQSIRRMARKCLFNADDWREYYQGLVLHLLGALKFGNLEPASRRTAFWGAATAQHFLESLISAQRQSPDPSNVTIPPEKIPSDLASPYGTMHPDSKMYIERSVDHDCQEQLGKLQAATLFIQAPRQMGKSSLMRRVIERARKRQHRRVAFIDFQKIPEQYFLDQEQFLIEFCLMMSDALRLPEAIDRYWQGRRTNIVKCSRYVSDYIMPRLSEPLILAMDEVERMLTSPFRSDFFGMLRTWHNDRVADENLARLTLFLNSSTEPYLFIDNPTQSPFNVAELFLLQDFTPAEVEELNRRHASPLNQRQIAALMDLVAGHPFLTRLALYLLATQRIEWETLLAQATRDSGPFGDHLRYYLLRVLQKPELKQALIQICRSHAYEENQIFHRLKGAGLIKKVGRQVVLRNNLYTRYFEERLNV